MARGLRTAAVVTICVSASAAFSIGPTLAAVWKAGLAELSAETAAFLILQTAATVGMAWFSHSAGATREWGKFLACLGLAAIIGLLQFGAALDVASHTQDDRAAVGKDRAAVAAALGAAVEQIGKLPQARQTAVTAAMVTAATKAEADECKDGVGGNCRTRQAELKDMNERRPAWAEIESLKAKQEKLGAGSGWIDGRAYRIGRIIDALGFNIGDTQEARTAWVIDWWPTFQAFVVELMASAGPYALARKDAPGERKPWRWPSISMPRRRRADPVAVEVPTASSEPAAVAAAVSKTTVSRTAATAAKGKKPKVSKAAAVSDGGSVVEWHNCRTVARVGNKLKPKDTYDGAYVPWCAEMKIEPVTFTAFGIAMKKPAIEGGCGVAYDEHGLGSKRGAYVGIALTSRPALVANVK